MKNKQHGVSSTLPQPQTCFRTLIAAGALCAVACPVAAQVTENVLYNFTGGSDGAFPDPRLLADIAVPFDSLRGLYGMADGGGKGGTYTGCGTVFKLTAPKNGEAAGPDKTR